MSVNNTIVYLFKIYCDKIQMLCLLRDNVEMNLGSTQKTHNHNHVFTSCVLYYLYVWRINWSRGRGTKVLVSRMYLTEVADLTRVSNLWIIIEGQMAWGYYTELLLALWGKTWTNCRSLWDRILSSCTIYEGILPNTFWNIHKLSFQERLANFNKNLESIIQFQTNGNDFHPLLLQQQMKKTQLFS